MAEPFYGEIRMCAFDYAPRDWAFCDGAILQIDQHQALFSLLGVTYGGNGRTDFALPDMRGRTPVHPGGDIPYQGIMFGVENVILSEENMPPHNHNISVSSEQATKQTVESNFVATSSEAVFANYDNLHLTTMNSNSIDMAGKNYAHENMQPFLTINFIIALEGYYPSRN